MYVGGHQPILLGPPPQYLSVLSVFLIVAQFTIFDKFSDPKIAEPC